MENNPQFPHAVPAPAYEFDQAQDSVFRDMAGYMRFVAVIELVAAVITAIAAVAADARTNWSFAVGAVINGALAILLWSSGSHMKRIAQTSGNDISHLMASMRNLSKYFKVRGILYAIVLALVGIGLVLVLLAAGAAAAG